MHFPRDKRCSDTDPLWQASWSEITQHTSPLAWEAAPKSLFWNSSIPRVLIKIYWVIFAKLNGPSYSNYQLLNVSAGDVTWWLAFLFKRIVPPPPPFILSFHFFKKPNELNVSIGVRGGKTSPSYTYSKSFLIGPLVTGVSGFKYKLLIPLWKWGAKLEIHLWAPTERKGPPPCSSICHSGCLSK